MFIAEQVNGLRQSLSKIDLFARCFCFFSVYFKSRLFSNFQVPARKCVFAQLMAVISARTHETLSTRNLQCTMLARQVQPALSINGQFPD